MKVKLRETGFQTRRPCAICGGHTQTLPVIASFRDDIGNENVLCKECLRAGGKKIRERLLDRAELLESNAELLRKWANEQWELPSHKQFEQMIKQAEKELGQAHKDDEWDEE